VTLPGHQRWYLHLRNRRSRTRTAPSPSRVETPFRREGAGHSPRFRGIRALLAQTVHRAIRFGRLPATTLATVSMYVDLFAANADQIRDPDLIYPGGRSLSSRAAGALAIARPRCLGKGISQRNFSCAACPKTDANFRPNAKIEMGGRGGGGWNGQSSRVAPYLWPAGRQEHQKIRVVRRHQRLLVANASRWHAFLYKAAGRCASGRGAGIDKC